MKLILASNNAHKLAEIKEILGGHFEEILTLREAGIEHETVEDGETFLDNARKKAREIAALSGCCALADDSGLCVDALGGAPGVYSARFAGEHGNDGANNALLLEKLRGEENRAAHFTCAVVLAYPDGRELSAEGYFYGQIAHAPAGENGFGYDPLFYLPDYACTSAQLTPAQKNSVSHRGKALRALLEKLEAETDYTAVNARTIDRWVDEGWEWGVPVSHEEYENAKRGEWRILLTPTKPVPASWFPPLEGARVLGLAAGGGQQMPILAARGAKCTVLDYSERQIDSERLVAEREGYEIETVRADMTRPLPFADGSFDLIVHPVSNCYIREVEPVWRECFRVLRPGGLLMAGLDNGFNYLFDENEPDRVTGRLPFDPLQDPRQLAQLEAEDCGVQFSHTIAEQIGGQLRAGFRLLDVYDDTNGSGVLDEHGVPCFWATLAVRDA